MQEWLVIAAYVAICVAIGDSLHSMYVKITSAPPVTFFEFFSTFNKRMDEQDKIIREEFKKNKINNIEAHLNGYDRIKRLLEDDNEKDN